MKISIRKTQNNNIAARIFDPTSTLPMETIGRWKDGKMDEEGLFWDNQAFMKQIGIAS